MQLGIEKVNTDVLRKIMALLASRSVPEYRSPEYQSTERMGETTTRKPMFLRRLNGLYQYRYAQRTT